MTDNCCFRLRLLFPCGAHWQGVRLGTLILRMLTDRGLEPVRSVFVTLGSCCAAQGLGCPKCFLGHYRPT
jgi:hypothetical protein